MARTPSTMVELGSAAPDFTLPDTVSGNAVGLNDVKSDVATVVLFICNHCPFVIHINPAVPALVAEFKAKGVSFVGISSNDVANYPDDAPDKMKEVAAQVPYDFPYLYDESQEVAKAYNAACTPDIFVYDKDLKLVYRGQFDASRPGMGTASGDDLRKALNQIVDGESVFADQKPSIGCNIKWKA